MNYFDDLKFVNGSFSHDSISKRYNRSFDGYYGIQFISKGEISVQVEGQAPWKDVGPLVFFTAPGKKYTYYTPHGTREHLFLCFRGERVQRYIAGGLFPAEAGTKIPITAPDELVKLFLTIFLLLRKNDFTSQGEAILNTEKLLLYIAKQPKLRQQSEAYRNMIKTLEDEIADHPGKNWNISELAAKYHLSDVHFRRLFINETGSPPWKYVMNCRIRYACQLLHSSHILIKEIANECGFKSEANFSRQFHKIMKISPAEFKQNS